MLPIDLRLSELNALGVHLGVANGRLKIRAPNDVLVPEILDELKARKSEIVEHFMARDGADMVRLDDADRARPLPLSHAQERLWFLDRLEGANPLYNIQLCLRLRGDLDVGALESALARIVERHEILRTRVITAEDGEPRQLITDASPTLSLASVDGRGGDSRQRLDELIAADASMPFRLSDELKLRATLVAIEPSSDLAGSEHVLLVTTHHVASDGWSLDVLGKELCELYNAAVEGRPDTLPELAFQYADFAAWQRSWLDEARLEEQSAYWREQLRGAPALADLPLDGVRPAVQRFEGSTLEFSIPPSLSARLAALGARLGATRYMLLLGAFDILLSRYAGTDDVVVGSPIANRVREDIEPLIGFFVNTLVLRTRIEDDMRLADVVARVRDVTLSAYQHQDIPFEKLVERLQPPRSTAFSPLFQVLFQLQNEPTPDLVLNGLEVEFFEASDATAKFDLTLGLRETGSGLEGWLNYSTALFERSTIERLAGHYVRVLEQLAERPEARVSELSLVGEAEREQLLIDRNATAMEYPRDSTVAALVAASAARVGESVAVVGPDDAALTYAGLEAASNRLAHHLIERGAGPGDRVGVYLERSVEMVVALVAVMKSGAAYVPLDPLFPPERLAYMASDARLKTVITERALLGTVPGAAAEPAERAERAERAEPVVLDAPGAPWRACSDAALDRSRAEATAYVIYTSGSTGQPKGVSVGHRALVNFLCSMGERPGLSEQDRLLAVTTLSFDIAGLELYLPLVRGARVVVASREEAMDPGRLAARLSSCGATLMQATPASWKLLVEHGWTGDGALKVLCGGEPLSRELADRLVERCAEVWNLYGPTETTIWSTLGRVSGSGPITVGTPIGNTEVYVLDAAMNVQPVGVPGELYIGGEGVAEGYLERAQLTAERFVADPFGRREGGRLYRTGDRARWRADGELEVLGRLDDQVKLRGYRIEPGEIRARLVEQGSVADAVVVVREDEPGEARLVAYLVAAGGAQDELDLEGLRAALKETLPEYMVPGAWVELERLPLTPNGKVDRRGLPAPELGRLSGGGYVAPRSDREREIAAVWSRVLGEERVGVTQGFFELGGHSLLAVRLVTALRAELGIELSLLALFQGASVAELAAGSVDGSMANAPALPPIEPADRSAPLPASLTQERFLFLHEMYPESAAYNVPIVFALRGELDGAAFERAIEGVVARHEALRTTFETNASNRATVTQRIHAKPNHGYAFVDLSASAEPRAEAWRRCEQEVSRPFDLHAGPVMRVTLYRCSPSEHVFCWVLHHVASDGWSSGLFLDELAALYEQERGGATADLEEPALQYADFGQWERAQLEAGAFDEQLRYWTGRFADAPEPLSLPSDRPRPAALSYRGASVSTRIAADRLAALQALAQAQGVTLFTVLLGAFQILLQRYSGQGEICVGAPIARRTRAELSGVYGCLISSVALKSDLSGDPRIGSLLAQASRVGSEAFANQDVPFDQVVEAVNPARDTSITPLFQAMFIFHARREQARSSLAGLELEALDLYTTGAKYDLTLELSETDDGVVGSIEYATDLFERSTIERLAGHYVRVLEQLAERPEARVSELSLVGEAEREQLLIDRNATAMEYPRDSTVAALVAASAARVGESVAVVGPDDAALTYAGLEAASNRLAHHLIERGAGPGDRVGVYLERSVEMVVALVAVMKSGAAYVPLDPLFPPERLAYMASDARLKTVITERALLGTVPGAAAEPAERAERAERAEPVVLDAPGAPWRACSDAALDRSRAEATAYVIYTSGSTGQPKGVSVGHRALVNFLCSMGERPGLSEQDRLLAVTTLSFDIAGLELYLPLVRGARVVVASREEAMDPGRLAARLSSCGATLMQATPASWKLLVEHGWTGDGALKVLCGGEPLSRELADRLVERCAEVWNLYGPTETTIWSTLGRVSGSGPITVGTPIGNTEVYVLDAAMNVQPVGVPGELYIGGEGVAEGYLERAQLTAERFVADPFGRREGGRLYRTGDRARWRADGELEVLGRLDDQVKLRGYRIEPGEIRARLVEQGSVADAVVVVREDEPGEARLVAYLVAAGGAQDELDLEGLRAALKETLPEYMVPGAWVELERLPLTPNGKVDRRGLPAPELGRLSDRAYEAPTTETERVLAQIWSTVLGVERVGREDDFFALGGHSLKVIQLKSRIEQQLGAELPIRTLFERSTVAEQAAATDASMPPARQVPESVESGAKTRIVL